MKNKYIALFLIAFIGSSCNDMLQENPKYFVPLEESFNTAKDVELALNGCFGYLTSWDAYGQSMWETQEGASGLYWSRTNGSEPDRITSLAASSSDAYPLMSWRGLYKAIGHCNFLIKYAPNGKADPEIIKNAIAQAKFIRALCYYNIAFMWGDAPLRTDITRPDNINMARTPKALILKQVEQDLLDATQGLSPKSISKDSAVPCQETAWAMLIKLYWMMGSQDNTPTSPYWAKAHESAQNVIGKYSLEPKFGDLFEVATRESNEFIFRLNMSIISVKEDQGNRSSWLFSPDNSTSGISWWRYAVTKAFYDDFRGTNPTDPRVEATFLSDWKTTAGKLGAAYPYYTKVTGSGRDEVITLVKDGIDYTNPAINPTNPDTTKLIDKSIAKKFATNDGGNHFGWPLLKKTYDRNATAQRSNKHIVLLRYADFLLLMADVENELGNKSAAVGYINQVLLRARTSVTPAAIHPVDVPANITQDALRLRIYRERQFELVGECMSFIDVRRRGEEFFKVNILDRNNNHHITQAHAPVVKSKPFFDRLFATDALDVTRAMLLPIPQEEINNNSAITPSDQNVGY